ncbi:MAG: metal-sensing transcriptional repressor [Fusobacteriaceae bacterium]|nr:metal-sensing transcriptional repressor [Fusobacteriaceae bacterium]
MQADKKSLIRLLRTTMGQIEGIIKMIEEDQYCINISTQLLSTEAIIRKTNKEILTSHLKVCVKNALKNGDSDDKIDEFMGILMRLK